MLEWDCGGLKPSKVMIVRERILKVGVPGFFLLAYFAAWHRKTQHDPPIYECSNLWASRRTVETWGTLPYSASWPQVLRVCVRPQAAAKYPGRFGSSDEFGCAV